MSTAGADESRVRAILASVVEGIVVVDHEQRVELVNPAIRQFLALQSEPLGQHFGQIIPHGPVQQMMMEVLARGKPQSCETTFATLGRPRHFSVAITPLHHSAGEGGGAVAVFHDVTQLRELEGVSSDFVANVSHELRTPVAILAGYIENLADDPAMPRKEQAEIFRIMEDHARRLKALLDDLLTLGALESRREVLDFAELDLGKFFRQLARDWQPALAGKDMAVVLELQDDLPPVRVDRFRFEQVLHNLFDNAFKYTPIEGQIRVRAAVVGAEMEIVVEDNGAGIPAADLPHIFERFYRVDKGRSRKYGGTGLGLSIVKHIVTLHGGTVHAESTLGMTTRIIIKLPLAPEIS